MIFVHLIVTFLLIGIFGFGGGYGMLSLIQTQVVNHYHWLTTAEFTNMVALSQVTPGPIGINAATYCGYVAVLNAGHGHLLAIVGSIVATVSLMLPSVVLMIVISKVLLRYMNHPSVEGMFAALRPTVIGLLLAAVLMLMNEENFSSIHTDEWQFWVSVCLFVATFVATGFFKMNPIKMIALAACVGILLL